MDPAARWSAADRGKAHFIYSTNYLVDLDNGIIVDVEPTATIRQAENKAARDMIGCVMAQAGLYPARLVGDTGYGSAEMLGWLVYEYGIEPHIAVLHCLAGKQSAAEKGQIRETRGFFLTFRLHL